MRNGILGHVDGTGTPDAAVRAALREHAGLEFAAVTPTGDGESGGAFWVTDRAGSVSVLKVFWDPPDGLAEHLQVLDEMTGRLRGRRYPAARLMAAGDVPATARVPGFVFWVLEKLPGASLQRAGMAVVAGLVPELMRLNDAQAGLGAGSPQGWRELIVRTLAEGGDGYCLHETLRADAATRDLLAWVQETADRCGAQIPERNDYVHFDFSLANLLTDGKRITGVVDINPPVLTGDRAFDLVTLLFYCYGEAPIRQRLRTRILELTTPAAVRAYLAHMALRQVEWSVRHYPCEPLTRRFRKLAEMIMRDETGRTL